VSAALPSRSDQAAVFEVVSDGSLNLFYEGEGSYRSVVIAELSHRLPALAPSVFESGT